MKIKFNTNYSIRLTIVLIGLCCLTFALMLRVIYLVIFKQDYWQQLGNEYSVRHADITAHRGVINDQNGEPLAVSTKVYSLWFDATQVDVQDAKWYEVARLLQIDADKLLNKLKVAKEQDKLSVDLIRMLPPPKALTVLDLGLSGLYKKDEYKRFYPAGNLVAPLVGITNIDNVGIEGLELAYNHILTGKNGRKRFTKDSHGRLLDIEQIIKPSEQGKDLTLSIDLRLQHIVMRELKNTVIKHNAEAGVVLVADVVTGNILALVNYPSYNPNDREKITLRKNIALVEVFEIGSTAKPFSMLAALASGKWRESDIVDVWPFKIEIDGYVIEDVTRNNGTKLNLTTVLINSSNVGMSKIALTIGGKSIYQVMHDFGLGKGTVLGFPGERIGDIPSHNVWSKSATATLSYGYGVSVNAVQLLQAYSVIANDGIFVPLTLIKKNDLIKTKPKKVFDENLVRRLKVMMQQVVENPKGVHLAKVDGYSVAGKSGTSRKTSNGKHNKDEHNALFVGFAPVKNSRYAVLAFIDNPKGEYFGGKVAAPLFSKVMSETLRLMNVVKGDK